MLIHQHLKNYFDYLEIEKGRSVKTVKNYRFYLEKFLKFASIKTTEDISLKKINDFRKKLNRDGLKKNSQSYYLIALRNFLKYLVKNDFKVISPDKIELPKINSRQIEILEGSELKRLLDIPNKKTLRDLRDRAILNVFFSTGLRLSELCTLNRYFDIDKGEISIRGKGGKIRLVFLSEEVKKILKEYLKARTDQEESLFVSLNRGGKVIGRITPRTVERVVDFRARQAGIYKKVHPHQLRHMFATDLLTAGADIRSVQELLGHRSISTTQIYTHLTNPQLKEIHKKFHGKSG